MRSFIIALVAIASSCAVNSYGQFSFLVQSSSKKSEIHALDGGTSKEKPKPILGAFTFPFKYRPQTGIFEPSLSLSGAVGVSFPINNDPNSSISFLGSFGPSSITLKKTNSTDTGTTTRSAATTAFTILGQWNKIQIAVSVGIDDNLDNSIDRWQYQSQPWLSFGIGYSIFSSN